MRRLERGVAVSFKWWWPEDWYWVNVNKIMRASFFLLFSASVVVFSGAIALGECTIYRNGRRAPCPYLKSAVSGPPKANVTPQSNAGAQAGVLQKLMVSPEIPLESLRFSSLNEFREAWRMDSRTLLQAAVVGLQQDHPKLNALWDGKRRRLSLAEVRIAQDIKSSLSALAIALARRMERISINLVPSQEQCGNTVLAFVFGHQANRNQMNACPLMISSTWQDALQTAIHEATRLEYHTRNECLVTAVEYSFAIAAGFEPMVNGYQKTCGF